MAILKSSYWSQDFGVINNHIVRNAETWTYQEFVPRKSVCFAWKLDLQLDACPSMVLKHERMKTTVTFRYLVALSDEIPPAQADGRPEVLGALQTTLAIKRVTFPPWKRQYPTANLHKKS